MNDKLHQLREELRVDLQQREEALKTESNYERAYWTFVTTKNILKRVEEILNESHFSRH